MARSQVLIALAITLFAALAFADDVVVLTPENFDEEVGQDRYALVEFFAPWCGHCQKLAPDYERLASSFKNTDTVLIAKVDCTEYDDLYAKYDVTGYPTIHWFPEGSMQPRKYEGIRTADDLADFVNAEAGTGYEVGYCIKLVPEYEKLASYFKEAQTLFIAKVSCDEHKDLCMDNNVTGYPTIMWFPKGSLEAKRYNGVRT